MRGCKYAKLFVFNRWFSKEIIIINSKFSIFHP